MEFSSTASFVWSVCSVLFFAEYAIASDLLFDDLSSKIINGEAAKKGEFPWMAMITDNMGNHHCGGALLNHRYVLTAAHCTNGAPLDYPSILVRFGALHIDIEEEGISIHTVRRIVRHPNNNYIISDIALLELSDEVQFTETVKPIQLPDPSLELLGKMATVAGWGKTTTGGRGSDTLLKAEIPMRPAAVCKTAYEPEYMVSEDMLCAGANGKGSCNGDSGGPLMWTDENDVWFIIGIVSWGLKCGEYPGVFSSVQYALPWILSTMG